MAEEKTVEKAVEQASKYSKRELITAAKSLFKVKSEIMAGALYGAADLLTVEEAKTLLDAFRIKEVK